jgi:hypothetical protein
MKKVIITIMALLISGSVYSADWVDQGDGTWTTSVVYTAATTQEKDDLEQLRAYDNYLFRCSGSGEVCTGDDRLTPDQWVAGQVAGIQDTQHGGTGLDMYKFCQSRWNNFVKVISRKYPHWVSAPTSDLEQNARDAVIPATPAP